MSDTTPALVARGVTKRYDARAVLSEADLTVSRGEVHALVGPNGSGKSTFVKVLSGFHAATEYGELTVCGRSYPASASAPALAQLGVRVVHQDPGLFEELSILENIALAAGYRQRRGLISWDQTRRRAAAALRLVGLDVSPDAVVGQLAVWQRVAVAFARSLYDGLDAVGLLILDEITAALPRDQVVEVLENVRKLRGLGAGILYVTHRFEEVFEVADRVTVLVDGKVIATGPVSSFTPDSLVRLVAGHAVTSSARRGRRDRGEARVVLSGLSSERLDNIDLTVAAGEICGVIGRAGCGRSALGRTLFGLERWRSGTLELNGRRLTRSSVSIAMRSGVAYVPQDRIRQGVLLMGTVRENATLTDLPQVARAGLIEGRREREVSRQLITRYAVTPADPEKLMLHLSGGNQQKVLVARWMTTPRAILVLDEPTEGVDAGSRAILYRLISEARAAGAAVIVLTSSIEEVIELCDRAVLMSNGAITGELTGPELTAHNLEQALLIEEPSARGPVSESGTAEGESAS
jgi:ribose transport system ATP-binding protein